MNCRTTQLYERFLEYRNQYDHEWYTVNKNTGRGLLSSSVDMKQSWHTKITKTFWYRSQRRQDSEAKSIADIELVASKETNKRANSSTWSGPVRLSSHLATPKLDQGPCEPILLMLDFEDGPCIKSLDYGTFSHWDAIEGLLVDVEKEGIVIGELWDENEKMRIRRGDWDARVRPGWDVHVRCQDLQLVTEACQSEDDSDSDALESDDDRWLDDVLDNYQEDWCLPRWRDKVEQDNSASKYLQEPSWIIIALGFASVVLFIIAGIVYTA